MRHSRAVRSVLGLGVCLVLFVGTLASLLYARDPEASEIAELIRQLGDDSYPQREAACRALEKLGEPALPALRQYDAKPSADLEVQQRVKQVMLTILQSGCESKSTRMRLAIIPAGAFKMGSPAEQKGHRDDETEHDVAITTSFLLGINEVTQAEYELVMKTNPSAFSPKGTNRDKVAAQPTDRFPVEHVSWFDAIAFCNQLSVLDGLAPYYEVRHEQREGDAMVSAQVTVLGGRGYRLPTEAEWEYACRARSETAFHFGGTTNGTQANFKSLVVTAGGYGGPETRTVELGRTAVVGSYPANRWGLNDLHGNVAEWCWDFYDKDYYATSPRENPRGPKAGPQRVLRGGSWMVADELCRSASRLGQTPDEHKDYIGFRVARTP